MTQRKMEEYPPEARRKEIFQALVEVQDTGEVTVPQSRKLIAERYGVSESQLKQIELEGLDRQWPPL
jgi:NADH:ubiquinone oxidoreductase subunit E